jgi:hypothetical protein
MQVGQLRGVLDGSAQRAVRYAVPYASPSKRFDVAARVAMGPVFDKG